MRTKARAPSSSPASTLRLLPCRRRHEYVRAEPWGCAGGQPLAEEGDVEGRAVLRLNHFKAGGCEQRMHLCRRGQVAGRRRLRPRHRIGWSVVGAFHHIVDAEPRAGLRHARRLPVEPRAILDVHRNVQRHGGIEGGVGKRQVDVQHELAGVQKELLDSVFGRVAPTDVELVDRGEVRRCQPFDIESGCRQGLEKRRSEVGHAIVACDRALELFHGRHPTRGAGYDSPAWNACTPRAGDWTAPAIRWPVGRRCTAGACRCPRARVVCMRACGDPWTRGAGNPQAPPRCRAWWSPACPLSERHARACSACWRSKGLEASRPSQPGHNRGLSNIPSDTNHGRLPALRRRAARQGDIFSASKSPVQVDLCSPRLDCDPAPDGGRRVQNAVPSPLFGRHAAM